MQAQHCRHPIRHPMSGFVKLFLAVALLALAWGIFGPRSPGGSRSRKDVATDDIVGFKEALERFRVDCGRYPTTSEGLAALVVPPLAMRGSPIWRGPYLDQITKETPGVILTFTGTQECITRMFTISLQ